MRQLAQRGKLSWQSSGSIVRVPSIATGTSMQHRRRRAQWGAARGRQSATVACAGFPANAEITKASHQSLTLTLVQRKVPQGIDSMNFLKRVTVTENPRVGGWIPPLPPLSQKADPTGPFLLESDRKGKSPPKPWSLYSAALIIWEALPPGCKIRRQFSSPTTNKDKDLALIASNANGRQSTRVSSD